MRILASAIGIALLAACASFGSTEAPATDADAGTATPDAAPREAASTKPATTDAAAATCGPLFAESFDDQALSGWTQSVVGTNSAVGIGSVSGTTGKTNPVLALGAQTMFSGGDLGTAFVEHSVPAPNVVSAHLAVDFLYAALDSFAEVGCSLGLVSSAPAREARIDLQMGNAGLGVVSTWLEGGTRVDGLGSVATATLPAPKTWTHIVSDVAIANGAVTLTMSIAGQVITLTPISSKDAVFDSIHVACGILDAYSGTGGTSAATVFLDDLSVSSCTNL